jgi:hypothetical protein
MLAITRRVNKLLNKIIKDMLALTTTTTTKLININKSNNRINKNNN